MDTCRECGEIIDPNEFTEYGMMCERCLHDAYRSGWEPSTTEKDN